MRNTLTLALSVFLLPACHKSSVHHPSATGKMKIDLTFPNIFPYSTSANRFELIISEPGGKVLLDTVAATAIPIITTLNTNDTLLNVATYSFSNMWHVTLYRDVNPSTITNLQTGWYGIQPGTDTAIPATILYKNLPAVARSTQNPKIVFSNWPGYYATSINYDSNSNQLLVSYKQYAGHYAWLLLPPVKLYNLHLPTSTADTVDLSTMDTANSLTFDRPFPFSIEYGTSLTAIPDTNDFSKNVEFISDYFPSSPLSVDVEYPKIPVEEYEMQIVAADTSRGYFYYFYGNTLPTLLPFPRASDFSVNSTSASNFSIFFPGAKPTYYYTQWFYNGVYFSIYAPPDSTNFQPQTWLNAQKTFTLQDIDYSQLKLLYVEADYVTGMSYAGYLSYVTSPDVGKTRRITSFASLQEQFRP